VTLTHSADCHDPVCPQPHEEQQAPTVDPVLLARATLSSHPSSPHPAIDRELLADAIFMHRLGQYTRSDALESSHLCFEDCAEDIAAHYGKAAR
jgi:hypothetical protein